MTMEETPPAAADRLADFSVSLVSAPGSPVLTRISIRPGARHLPLASTTSTPEGTRGRRRLATSAILPSSIRIAPGPS
jgi:hypothetical protein